MKFSKAILRKPGRSLVNGLRSSDYGIPDYDLALRQHSGYAEALRLCGLEIIMLDADESYPDSVFVEDTALLTLHVPLSPGPEQSQEGERKRQLRICLKNITLKCTK